MSKQFKHSHYLIVTTLNGNHVRGLGYDSHNEAVEAWYEHDNARLAGKRPHVRHYEVRAAADPKTQSALGVEDFGSRSNYSTLWVNVITPRGFGPSMGRYSPREKAARAAIHQFPKRNDLRQGEGGWYWDPFNRGQRTLAQGLNHLADIAERRGWIVKANDRWYATELAS